MKRGINRKTEDLNSKKLGINTRDILDDLDHSIKFSFKYIELNKKFNFNDCGFEYLLQLIQRLQTVSRMHTDKFKEQTLDSLSNHHIDWDNPKYTEDSFGLRNEDIADEAWQFGLDNNKFGRVHGFFIDNRFYIRWFDPKHRLWELEENKNDEGVDEDFVDIIKEQIIQNSSKWAKESLKIIEESYEEDLEEERKISNQLLDEMDLINNNICSNCKKKLKQIIDSESA